MRTWRAADWRTVFAQLRSGMPLRMDAEWGRMTKRERAIGGRALRRCLDEARERGAAVRLEVYHGSNGAQRLVASRA